MDGWMDGRTDGRTIVHELPHQSYQVPLQEVFLRSSLQQLAGLPLKGM